MATPWWVDRPGTFHEELTALDRAGIDYKVREDLKAQGILQIDATVDVGGEQVEVEVVYPDLYPYFRFEVFAPGLELPRHQNPFLKNLCLIGRSTDNWDTDATAAQFLIDQLPKVLTAGRAPIGKSPVAEIPQGEPLSAYYGGQDGAMFLIDSAWSIPADHERGWMKIGLDRARVATISGMGIEAPVIRGVVAEIQAYDHSVLAEADPALVASVADPQWVLGRWVRISPPPAVGQPPNGMNNLNQAIDRAWGAGGHKERYNGDHIEIAGVLFDEELTEGNFGDGWIFHVRSYGRGKLAKQYAMYIARVGRAGRDDLAARIPELHGLQDKTALVLGLGGIGAPVAFELARGGVGRLRLVDSDYVDPGTAVRHPLGLQSAGLPKPQAVASWISANLPYTAVETFNHRIGTVRRGADGPAEGDIWDELLNGVDIVIDATAEWGIHYAVSDLARLRGIPYVEGATRAGAWAGVLARISPAAGAPCWLCYQFLLEDLRTVSPPVGPSVDDSGMKQPAGCADATFTGAGFDVATFALALTRLAVGTMLEGDLDAYPSPNWDVAMVNLRDAGGVLEEPHWQTWKLDPHPRCEKHGT